MASYDSEHASDPPRDSNSAPHDTTSHRRPDLSTFFSNLSSVRPSSPSATHIPRPGAVPTPGDMAALYRNLIEAFMAMRDDVSADSPEDAGLLEEMIQGLVPGMEEPPETPQGVVRKNLPTLPTFATLTRPRGFRMKPI
ncbi:MAG: hypothetical protein Q9160_002082 [Pyrenula sp. 1 TL-2023]